MSLKKLKQLIEEKNSYYKITRQRNRYTERTD